MSCSYYTFKCNDYYCMKKQDYVSSDIYYKYCRDYSYDDCPIYKGDSSSSGCYLTTACVVAVDKGDNCDELNILRKFRDTYMNNDESLKKDIAEYYQIAPLIVEKINACSDYKKIYQDIYHKIICPCISHIKNKEYNQAYLLYKKMFCTLKEKYYNN